MNKILAVYAGSFDPFHVGHYDIYTQACNLFGWQNVVVAFGCNPAKAGSLEGARARAAELSSEIRTDVYSGFLHDYLKKLQSQRSLDTVVLVRGLRNGEDLAYESNQLKFIRDFFPEVQVAFFLCDPSHEHVSSSALRLLENVEPGSSQRYLPWDK